MLKNLEKGQGLGSRQKKQLEEIVGEYHQAFLDHDDDDSAECRHGTHKIELKSKIPVFSKQF